MSFIWLCIFGITTPKLRVVSFSKEEQPLERVLSRSQFK